MKRSWAALGLRTFCFLTLGAGVIAPHTLFAADDPASGDAPRAMLIHVDDMIEPILEQFVNRQIDRAVASGVNLIIFEIESPGALRGLHGAKMMTGDGSSDRAGEIGLDFLDRQPHRQRGGSCAVIDGGDEGAVD